MRDPCTYAEFLDVFSKRDAEALPPHRPDTGDHAIDIEPGAKLPHGRIYNLSEVKLATLKAYIETNLASGFIQRSSSPAAAPILFAKKKDGGLHLCVDYCALNSITINRYPIPIPDTVDLRDLKSRQSFTKLDLRGVYNLIRIRETAMPIEITSRSTNASGHRPRYRSSSKKNIPKTFSQPGVCA